MRTSSRQGAWALSDPRLSSSARKRKKCRYSQKNLGSIYSSLSPYPTHLSHTRNITLSRIKWERYIFIKKCIRSFIEVRHYCWLCFRLYLYYVYVYVIRVVYNTTDIKRRVSLMLRQMKDSLEWVCWMAKRTILKKSNLSWLLIFVHPSEFLRWGLMCIILIVIFRTVVIIFIVVNWNTTMTSLFELALHSSWTPYFH